MSYIALGLTLMALGLADFDLSRALWRKRSRRSGMLVGALVMLIGLAEVLFGLGVLG